MTREAKIEIGLDENLGQLLHKLFKQGHEEVEIRHPTEGVAIYTKDAFYESVNKLAKQKTMSPAQIRKRENRLKQIQTQRLGQFRQLMVSAEAHTVDVTDEEGFKDIDGNNINIDGLTFVQAVEYPRGIELKENELGCFMDADMVKNPIRIVSALQDATSG